MSVSSTRPPVARRPRAAATVTSLTQRWSAFVGAVLLWELVTRLAADVFFPPPSAIAVAAWRTWFDGPVSQLFLSDLAVGNLLPSLGRMLGAWALASIVGIALGLALGRSRTALDYVEPLLAFARAVPPPAVVPVFLVVFGLGAPMQLATIIFGVIWPVLLNSIDGARSVHPTQAWTAEVFRLPTHTWLSSVVLPAALPKIFAGLRVSLSISLILMVLSELVGSFNGIGNQLSQAESSFDYTFMWTIIVLLGVLGYLLNTALLAVQRRMLSWQPTAPGSES